VTRRQGIALLLALVVILAGGAAATAGLSWAALQLRSGRAFGDAAAASVGVEALAADWLRDGSGATARIWPIGDSALQARVWWPSPRATAVVELLVRRLAPDSNSDWAAPISARGYVRPPR
jgi:hypothetical protein